MAYRLTRRARIDLTAIYAIGSRQFGAAAADKYLEGFWIVAQFISDFPEGARVLQGLSKPLRVHPYRSHVIIYRIDDEDVDIVRVRHSRENWMDGLY